MLNRRTLSLAALLAALTGCASQPAATPVSLADTLKATPALSTLNELVVKAGMADTLRGAGPYTVFAPTNEAFKAVPAKTMGELSASPDKLKALLGFHLLPAKVMAADAKTGPAKSVQGANLAISRAGEFVTVEDAMVQTRDVKATNGVVHVIDRVLMPPK